MAPCPTDVGTDLEASRPSAEAVESVVSASPCFEPTVLSEVVAKTDNDFVAHTPSDHSIDESVQGDLRLENMNSDTVICCPGSDDFSSPVATGPERFIGLYDLDEPKIIQAALSSWRELPAGTMQTFEGQGSFDT